MEFVQHLTQLIRAGYQALYVPTSEEARCESELGRVAESLGMGLVTWDAVSGFSYSGSCQDPVEALNAIPSAQFDKNTIIVLRDFHPYLDENRWVAARAEPAFPARSIAPSRSPLKA